VDYTIRLLSAVSCTEEIQGKSRNIVYLFGTTKEGESIAVRTPLLLPYFQVVEPPQDIVKSLKQRDDVEKVEAQELWVDGAVKNCMKVTVPHPGKVPKIREWLKSKDLKLLAADIPFHHRYLYDNNIGGCVRVRGKKIIKDKWSCKVIEVVEILPAENFESNFKILSFDIENSIFERTIYCLSYCG
jgi:DNA polymerase I